MSTPTLEDILIPSDETLAKLMQEPSEDDTLDILEQAFEKEASKPAVPVQTAEDVSQDLSGLVAKTFFLRVRYGRLGITRQVPGANVLTTDADVSLLRVSKTLLESPELEQIKKHDSNLRKWLGNMCLPFLDWPGVLVLPKGLVQTAQAKLLSHKIERDVLVDAFIESYPKVIEHAATQLGTLFNQSEYLSQAEVKEKFVFDWAYKSFGTPDSLKEIDPELYAEQVAQQQAQIEAATDEIKGVMRQGLLEMVEHLKDRLTPGADGKPRILRETAVTNLQEFLETFDLRNVTDDKALALEVQKARALLSGANANGLRNSDEWREKIRVGMESISHTLGNMTEAKNGRKFRA